jgi:hypothetical protein
LTLNQVIQRVQGLAGSHKQINTFFFGNIIEWLSNGEVKYPACFVDVNEGVIDFTSRQTHYSVELWLADLENVDQDARSNEFEVFSDLSSIAQDLVAMIRDYTLQDDWTIAEVYPMKLMKEKFEDVTCAVMVTIEISTDFISDNCQVPKN